MTYSPDDTTPRPVLNATRARQGRWGRPVLLVLIFGTLLAALGMFAAWTLKPNDLATTGHAQEQVSGKTFDTPAPPSPTPQAP